MQPFPKLALAVLLAHLLGDFPLQTSNIVQGKDRGSRAYLVHGGVHFLVLTFCIAVFVGLELLGSLRFWIVVGVYIVVHIGIDRAKKGLVSTKKLPDSASVFVLNQVLHICTIILFAWFFTRPGWSSVRSQFSWSPAVALICSVVRRVFVLQRLSISHTVRSTFGCYLGPDSSSRRWQWSARRGPLAISPGDPRRLERLSPAHD
jgi:hypothetical protein